MVEFEIIKAEEVKFGRNNFIEISLKKAITDQGETNFISIARGFYLPDGEKGWKRGKTSITLPNEKEKLEKIAESIKSI